MRGGRPSRSCASIAALKPRGGAAAAARRSMPASGTGALASAISRRLYAAMRSRTSLTALAVRDRDQALQHAFRRAGLDRLAGALDALAQIPRVVGDDERCGGVEEADVAVG